VAALDDDYPAHSCPGQVEGRARSDNSTANNHHVGTGHSILLAPIGYSDRSQS